MPFGVAQMAVSSHLPTQFAAIEEIGIFCGENESLDSRHDRVADRKIAPVIDGEPEIEKLHHKDRDRNDEGHLPREGKALHESNTLPAKL